MCVKYFQVQKSRNAGAYCVYNGPKFRNVWHVCHIHLQTPVMIHVLMSDDKS